MKKYVNLYVKLNKEKVSLLSYIKDEDFSRILNASTTGYVPLNELLFNVWYFRKVLKEEDLNLVLSDCEVYIKVEEEKARITKKVNAFVTSLSYTVSCVAFKLDELYDRLSYEEKIEMIDLFKYLDGKQINTLGCYKMPLNKFIALMEKFVLFYPNETNKIKDNILKAKIKIEF